MGADWGDPRVEVMTMSIQMITERNWVSKRTTKGRATYLSLSSLAQVLLRPARPPPPSLNKPHRRLGLAKEEDEEEVAIQ